MDMKASFILKHKAVFLQLQKKFKEMNVRIYTKKKKNKKNKNCMETHHLRNNSKLAQEQESTYKRLMIFSSLVQIKT